MTRDQIIRMAERAGIDVDTDGDIWGSTNGGLLRFAALVAAAEREQCAMVCDQRKIVTPEWVLDQHYNQAASHCAKAIRARGGA